MTEEEERDVENLLSYTHQARSLTCQTFLVKNK
jgi:hypothetical protein